MMKKIMRFVVPFIDKMLSSSRGRIDFLRIGDDYGTQRGLLFSLDQWRKAFAPYLKEIADVIHSHGAYYYQHTCGGIRELIPDLINTGVDVLDPVQVKASGMEPLGLKRDFGNKIVFSGGVDEQELLPNGSPEEVRNGVLDLLEKMGKNGGFFIGSTHNLQNDIPTQNITAMYEAAFTWAP